jgi:hypothetical protein
MANGEAGKSGPLLWLPSLKFDMLVDNTFKSTTLIRVFEIFQAATYHTLCSREFLIGDGVGSLSSVSCQ